jgi:microcystin-dependent protein
VPETPRRKLRYPAETDSPDVPRDMQNLATDADAEDPGQSPIGAEVEYAGEGDPNANWMVEDGREISRTLYPVLFARIGTKWGAGTGSTTFNIPDSRGRVSVGAGTGAGLTARAVAQKAGEEVHLLGGAESGLAAHSHTIVQSDGVTFASISYIGGGNGGQTGDAQAVRGYNNGFLGISTAGPSNAAAAHNNMQPYAVKTKIIRVL